MKPGLFAYHLPRAALAGRAPGAAAFEAAAQAAASAVDPGTGSAELAAYKHGVVRAAVRRALEAAEKPA